MRTVARAYASVTMAKQSHEQLAAEIEAMSPDDAKDLRAVMATIPRLRLLIIASAVRALGAVRSYYDKAEGGRVREPDCASQMKAAAFLAAYADGLPVQTALNVNVDPTKAHGFSLGDALRASPALRDHLAKELAASESKALTA